MISTPASSNCSFKSSRVFSSNLSIQLFSSVSVALVNKVSIDKVDLPFACMIIVAISACCFFSSSDKAAYSVSPNSYLVLLINKSPNNPPVSSSWSLLSIDLIYSARALLAVKGDLRFALYSSRVTINLSIKGRTSVLSLVAIKAS